MKERLLATLRAATADLLAEAGDSGDLPEFAIEVPRQPEHGDFACNVALVLARRLRRRPRDIATRLAASLGRAKDLVARTEVAGPGFLNVWVRQECWRAMLADVLRSGSCYGRAEAQGEARVQVEFVSANPTGPLTLGHGRQAVLGDSIARMLEAQGWRVTREYYFNDGGRQMRLLGESVKARYLEQIGRAAPPPPECLADPQRDWPERIGELPVLFPHDGYQGEYIQEIASELRRQHGHGLADQPADSMFQSFAEQRIFENIRSTLAALRVRFDVYYNETSLYESGRIQETLAELRSRNLVYESEGAVWLRSTDLDLERDRVLVKRTGEPTYLLPDIAYHRDKFQRGFDRIIDVQGADHIDQFPFVRAAAGALGCERENIELVMHQFVTLTRGGEQVKQSTRRAAYVTVDELLEEVGVDVFRFFMIQRKADGHLDFDVDLAKEVDWRKNPAYYVQYAHARTCGIERKAQELGMDVPSAESLDPSPLELPEELSLIKKLAAFPQVVANATEQREPHHLAYYLREVAGLWNPYLQDGVRHRVLADQAGLGAARLGLAIAVRAVLANGLALLGISAPERM